MEVEESFSTNSGGCWPQTHTVYVRKYLASGLLQSCLQDTGKRREWIKSKMEMRLLLSIKCSGIYCESTAKWTLHPKSRFGVFLCAYINRKTPWTYSYFSSSQKRFIFFSQLKLCCFFCSHDVFSSPSHALAHWHAEKHQCQGSPFPKGRLFVTSAAWLGPVAVLHPMPHFPAIAKTRHAAEGQTPTHCEGSKIFKGRISSA